MKFAFLHSLILACSALPYVLSSLLAASELACIFVVLAAGATWYLDSLPDTAQALAEHTQKIVGTS